MYQPHEPSPDFNEEQVRSILEKTVLVGITYRTMNDEVASLEQFYGKIKRISRSEGLVLQLPTSVEHAIPPDLSLLEKASPGNYTLKTTGEVVENPDFIAMWTTYPKGYQL